MGRWILEIDHGRGVARWAAPGPWSGPSVLSPEGGVDLPYAAGLDLGEVDLPEGEDASVTIALARAAPVLALDDLDRLEGSPALLRRVLDDGSMVTILRGLVQDVERGSTQEPIELSIVPAGTTTTGTIPNAALAVSATTWPIAFVLHEADVGRCYPWIIGRPGSATAPGAPAVLAEFGGAAQGSIVVAAHRVEATTVTVFSPESQEDPVVATYSDVLNIIYEDDLAGNTVASVSYPASFVSPAERLTFFTGWGLGGLLSPKTGRAARGWADVVEAVMSLRGAGVPIDWNKLRGQADQLNRYNVDLYWDEPTSAWDLVADLLGMIPGLRAMRSEHGIWWRAPSWQTPSWQAVTDIVVGRGATREGRVRTRLPESGIVNDVTVEYARTVGSGGAPTGLVRLTAASDPSDTRIVGDPRAARSQARPGGVRTYSTEIPTWDHGTAQLHASGVLALSAEPRRGVAVSVRATARTERLLPGDVVSLTEPTLGWSDLAAEVEGVTLGGSSVGLDLTVLTPI